VPWINKYRFTLTHPVAGSQVVTPLIDDLVVEGKQESRFVWRKQIATPLLFVGADFEWLYDIETGADRCEKIELVIEQLCGGDWEDFYTGYLSLDDGDWNPVQCRVIIPVSLDDEYACIFQNWKEEKNIFLAVGNETASALTGYIQMVQCSDTVTGVDVTSILLGEINVPTVDSCLPDANEWTVLEAEFTGVTESGGLWDGTARTEWVRERVDSSPLSPPGEGWVSIGGNSWVRELNVVFLALTSSNNTSDATQTWEVAGEDFEADNGRTLENVLDLLDPCDGAYTFQSDFFRINAGSLPVTAPYAAAEGGFDSLLIFQKSDIVRPAANYNATKGIITLEKVLQWLAGVFNVEWRIEGTVIRIEHLSYFEGNNGLDLTDPQYLGQITKKNRYSYINTKKPKYERFSWMDTVTDFFTGSPIIYLNACANKEDNNEVFRRVEEVSTDIAFMNGNEDEVSLQGFVFAAVYSDGGSGWFLNVEDTYINGHLSWTKLHDNYWRHGRPQLSGRMNGIDDTFETAFPSKQQEELEVQIPCADFAAFNPGQRVKTEIGWGEVAAWSYSAKKCSLTLQILHE